MQHNSKGGQTKTITINKRKMAKLKLFISVRETIYSLYTIENSECYKWKFMKKDTNYKAMQYVAIT